MHIIYEYSREYVESRSDVYTFNIQITKSSKLLNVSGGCYGDWTNRILGTGDPSKMKAHKG